MLRNFGPNKRDETVAKNNSVCVSQHGGSNRSGSRRGYENFAYETTCVQNITLKVSAKINAADEIGKTSFRVLTDDK